MSETVSEQGRTRAIIAHITLIGWIIALVMNTDNSKDKYASFYIRQMLGIILIAVGLSVIGMILPIFGTILPLLAIVPWIISLVNATQDKMEPLPFVGDMFQEWFKTL
ncbi:MAG: putative membrane protein [Crocinitomicaceae bacterium]|jgi:uncharacterized membrane protein